MCVCCCCCCFFSLFRCVSVCVCVCVCVVVFCGCFCFCFWGGGGGAFLDLALCLARINNHYNHFIHCSVLGRVIWYFRISNCNSKKTTTTLNKIHGDIGITRIISTLQDASGCKVTPHPIHIHTYACTHAHTHTHIEIWLKSETNPQIRHFQIVDTTLALS